MLRTYLILLLGGLVSLSPASAQTTDLGEPIQVLSDLPPCDQLTVDGERNLLLLDRENSKLYKYFALTAYDSLISLGGKGNRAEGLLSATKMSAHNRQALFVLDEGSQRLLLLNPNFRLLESLDWLTFSGLDQGASLYPASFEVSGIGELFLLNQWDNKIYKFSPEGSLELSFGGLDYGAGSLYDPVDIQANAQNLVYVSDTTAQHFQVFDLFGRYRFQYQPETPFRWQQFTLEGNYLLCWNHLQLYLEHLPSKKSWVFQTPGLLSAVLDREFLYLLQENRVHLYRLAGK